MLFDTINSEDIRVRIDYGKAEFCGTGPFMWIRSNANNIHHLIEPETLINYMRPPMDFRERQALFCCVLTCISISLVLTIGFILILNNVQIDDVQKFTWVFLGLIFGLVFIELFLIVYWLQKMEVRLIDYVETLNRNQLRSQGIEFYYPEGYCWGKNVNMLGIRRYYGEDRSLLVY